MRRLALLFSTLIISVIYLLVPDTEPIDFFPFSDMKTTLEWYVFYLCEHLILIVFALFIYMESDKYKIALFVFLLIQIADTIDFCLTYGFVWFHLDKYPVGFNLIKIVIFMIAIAYELGTDNSGHGEA